MICPSIKRLGKMWLFFRAFKRFGKRGVFVRFANFRHFVRVDVRVFSLIRCNFNPSVRGSKLQVENVDFSQYSAGVNPKTKSYDPSKNQFRGSKNSNASKAKQRYKKSGSFSGKSVTYKK